jgi:hypothetical protein
MTYYIVVDGYGGRQGLYGLVVEPPNPCGNDVREAPEECDGGDVSGCATGQCTAQCTCVPPSGLPDLTVAARDVSVQFGATVPETDIAEGCAPQATGLDLVRFATVSHNDGTADWVLGAPQCPSPCSAYPNQTCGNPAYTCGPVGGYSRPHYDNYVRHELLDASGRTIAASKKQGWCLRDDGDCPAPKYTCGNQGHSAGCGDVYQATVSCQYIDVTDVPSGDYVLQLKVDPFERVVELDESNNIIQLPITIAKPTAAATATATTTPTVAPTASPTSTPTIVPTATPTVVSTATATPVPTIVPTPASGDCAAPVVVPAMGGTFTGTTTGASAQTGSCGQSGVSPEQVFQWTPTFSGKATIETCGAGTAFDTVLYMRTGPCASGAQLACNDDACANASGASRASRATKTVTAGTTYYLFVDGFNGAKGDFTLTVAPPPGTCSAPIILPAAGGAFTGTTSGTSALAGTCATSGNSPEKVFKWVPSKSGTATIQTCGGTSFDTVLYMRTGTCASGAQIACNNNTAGCATGAGSGKGSKITRSVTAGTTYYLVVDGYNASAGTFTLSVAPPP